VRQNRGTGCADCRPRFCATSSGATRRPRSCCFIKTGPATDFIAKADTAVTAYPQCARRVEPVDPSSRIDYLLRSTADDQRLIRPALVPIVIAGP
jgi:hypothetical protein